MGKVRGNLPKWVKNKLKKMMDKITKILTLTDIEIAIRDYKAGVIEEEELDEKIKEAFQKIYFDEPINDFVDWYYKGLLKK